MHNGHEEMNQPSESAQEKMRKLIDDVAAKSRSLFTHGLESARELFGEKAESLKKAATDIGADEIPDKVRTYVRRHPLQSVGIAAGVGVLLGLIFRPRKK